MGIFSENKKLATEVSQDELYVIYGPAGSGKTTLASTFPKSVEKPMLIVDILEGGTDSIATADRDKIVVVNISTYEQLDELLEATLRGYDLDSKGQQVPMQFSSIVIDSLTNLEFILKEYLMQKEKKTTMNLNLWGQTKQNQDAVFMLMKTLHVKLGIPVVGIAHEKVKSDERHPEFDQTVLSLMNSAGNSLAAKASHIWYTKIDSEEYIDEKSNERKIKIVFKTIINEHPYLVTKCRKPKEFEVPAEIVNLTYPLFKKNVLDKIKNGG